MKDKIIAITGASSGIGAAVAREVAKRGAATILASRREDRLRAVAAESGPRSLPVVADVTKRADVERIVQAGLAQFGRIDVWINNAGRGITRPVAELTDDDLDEMILVNVKSALYGMQAVLPSMRSAYSAAKHALMSLTANMRVDRRADFPDIHGSSVLPGVVATDFGLS